MLRRYKYSNTRQYLRLSAPYLVRYRTVKEEEVEAMNLSTTKDISAGGVSFIVKEALASSDTLELEISFPATNYPIKVIAKIIRIEPLPNKTYEVAAHFVKINDEDKKAIDEYIKRTVGNKPQQDWWWRKL